MFSFVNFFFVLVKIVKVHFTKDLFIFARDVVYWFVVMFGMLFFESEINFDHYSMFLICILMSFLRVDLLNGKLLFDLIKRDRKKTLMIPNDTCASDFNRIDIINGKKIGERLLD